MNNNNVSQGDEGDFSTVKSLSNGQRLKLLNLRNSKGLSQKELASRAFTTVKIVSDYESGKGSYDAKVYNKLLLLQSLKII